MRSFCGRCLLAAILLFSCVPCGKAQSSRKPITDRELMALVAGGAVSEDIAAEIDGRGLAFRPNDPYRSLIATAGSDAVVVEALKKAKVIDGSGQTQIDKSNEYLEHIANAGKLVRGKQYEQAAKELAAAVQTDNAPEAGYVMGGLLSSQERWRDAAVVYLEVLRQDPDFTEAHTKLSYALHQLNDPEDSLREAKSALAQSPHSAEAHKNAGIALDDLEKFDAAQQEYREALRLKPDYALVHYDLGVTFQDRNDLDQAILEYRKAIALDPQNEKAHYNLGNAYSDKGDIDSAIREYREAKRLNPNFLWARQNLADVFMHQNKFAEAAREYRELQAIVPDSEEYHQGLGNALLQMGNLTASKKEFETATEKDPSDVQPLLGLGSILLQQKDYDAALDEFQKATRLDATSNNAFRGAGRALLAKKDFADAAKELKRAVELKPSDELALDFYGQALEGSGDTAGAIEEFRQVVALAPKLTWAKLELASALEKNGDWLGALTTFQEAALADPTSDVQDSYKSAQDRFNKHIAALKAAGNSREAADLESRVKAARKTPSVSESLDAMMEKGLNDMASGHREEAENDYKEAVGLAEKLQPTDDRLEQALMQLGSFYTQKHEIDKAEAVWERALKVTEEAHGAHSSNLVEPLQGLGKLAMIQKDYKTAVDFFTRAAKVNEENYGEVSDKFAESMIMLTMVYGTQGAFDQAEPVARRAVHIEESLHGKEDLKVITSSFVSLRCLREYKQSGKTTSCDERLIPLMESKISAATAPFLGPPLKMEAAALRNLGAWMKRKKSSSESKPSKQVLCNRQGLHRRSFPLIDARKAAR